MKKHIVITGKVQGVGFRYWLYKAAVERNINGWVKNKISGEVEALLIGNDSEINKLIKLCKKGPSSSKVTIWIPSCCACSHSRSAFLSRKDRAISRAVAGPMPGILWSSVSEIFETCSADPAKSTSLRYRTTPMAPEK